MEKILASLTKKQDSHQKPSEIAALDTAPAKKTHNVSCFDDSCSGSPHREPTHIARSDVDRAASSGQTTDREAATRGQLSI
jgi:hypothetical protein